MDQRPTTAGAAAIESGGRWALVAPNATVFVASLCIMVAELVAGRIVAQHLGASLYTWTSCIGVFLAGISLGNYIGGRVADRYASRSALSVLFILASASCLLVPALNTLIGDWPWIWDRSWPSRIFLHTTSVFVLPAMLLGTIGPVAAKMALAEGGRPAGRTLGQVYAWGAVGGIAGTYATGFYLIANWGTTSTVMAVSAVLALLGAAFGIRRWVPHCWIVLCLASWFAAVRAGGPLESYAFALRLKDRPDPDVVWEDESAYAHIWVSKVHGQDHVRTLTLDRLTHSIVDLQRPTVMLYDYTQVYDGAVDAFSAAGAPVKALVLGGGGYAFPRLLELTRPGSRIDVAEIDPAVTRAARAACGLPDDSSIRVHTADARALVADLVRRKRAGDAVPAYDYIFGDTFSGTAVPYHLTPVEFVRQLGELLGPRGVYLMTCIDMQASGRFLASMIATCRAVFPKVYVVACDTMPDDRSTFVVLGARTELDLSALEARIRGTYAFGGRVWTQDETDRFVAASRGVLLTDDFAPVENMLAAVARLRGRERSREYLDAGARAVRMGNARKAERYYEKLLSFDPANGRAYYNLGALYSQQGRVEEALAMLAKAQDVEPRLTIARDQISKILFDLGRMEEVRQLWSNLLESGDDVFAAHVNLGEISAHEGHTAAAVLHWEAATALQPGNALVRFKLAMACASLGLTEEAIGHYRAVLDAAPGFAEAYNNLGILVAQRGNHAAAAALFAEAVRLNPGLDQARDNLERTSALLRPSAAPSPR